MEILHRLYLPSSHSQLPSFNRREEEFTDLRAYNDYLEFVEDIAFNLIERKDVAATEAKLAAYASENAISIAQNAALANQEHSSLEEREAAQREISRLAREAARREEEDEKQAREAGRREIIQAIAEGNGDAEEVARQTQKVVLKQGQKGDPPPAKRGAADPSFTISGLKAPVVVETEKPYDPFGGLHLDMKYFSLLSHYEHPWLDNARNDPQITAGGYDVREYYARALLEGNAGLCCFIADEKMVGVVYDDEVATVGAAAAAAGRAGDIDMGDDNA